MGQTREQKVLKSMTNVRGNQKFTPIATDMFLPNHSGVSDKEIRRDNEVRHAKWFGSIQAAIDDLPSTGGTVFIDAGTYNINSTIIINKERVTLCGEGKSSIIYLADNSDCNMIELNGTDKHYMILRDFYLDGNKANNASGKGIYVNMTDDSDDSYFLIENIAIHKTKDAGMDIPRVSQEVWIRNIRIQDTSSYGLSVNGNDMKIFDSVISGCDNSGIYVTAEQGGDGWYGRIKCFGNAQTNSNGANFEIVGKGQNFFTDCEAQNSYYRGWYIHDDGVASPDVVILSNCKGEDNGLAVLGNNYGLEIHDRHNVQIIGGQYVYRTGANNQKYGIYITGDSTNIFTIGAQFSGNTTANYLDSSTGVNTILACNGYTADTLQTHSLAVASITTDHIGEKTAAHNVVIDNTTEITGKLGINSGNDNVVAGKITGNARGQYALDLQSYRTNANEVASGLAATTVGNNNRASEQQGLCIGAANYNDATLAISLGVANYIYSGATYSTTIGNNNFVGSSDAAGYETVIGTNLYMDSYDVGYSGNIGAYNNVHARIGWAVGVGLTNNQDWSMYFGIDGSVVGADGDCYFPHGKTAFGSKTAPSYTVDITGNLRTSTGFGCNGTNPQTAYASGGALNAYAAGANGLSAAADMSALHALVVKMRAALVANGIMS